MCGIAGFYGRFEPDLLDRMNAAQSHRGPDDSGVFYNEEVSLGLAHRRLSIIDLDETGHQPMTDIAGLTTIVYNGEIYNYRQLRAELEADGFGFRSTSDTEVLLNLYLRDGHDMLTRVNGIFAFAIWDSRNSTLFLARDGLGVKPLYFTQLTEGFLFASEMKALLKSAAVPRTIDPVAVHYYLTYLWCPAPRTMLQGVQKLEPGWALVITKGEVARHWQFYDLPYQQLPTQVRPGEAVRRTEANLRNAVERQLVADVPIGAFLSGGLDSSAIVALASQALGPRRLPCFTIGFTDDALKREGFAEDLPFARRVADHLDVDLHTVYVGPEMVDNLESMVYHLDEPQADAAPINVMLISRLARETGLKVLLSGAGGDDVFAGYRRHRALQLERAWSWLPQPGRDALGAMARRAPTHGQFARRFRKAFRFAGYNGDRRISSYFTWIEPSQLNSLYGPALREALATVEPLQPMLDSLARLPADVPALNRMLYLEGKHFLADHNLNYTDKMGMAEGVEIRVPLLDVDLIAAAATFPTYLKYRGAESKWVLKKAMEPYLPREVIYRSKTGFGAPMRYWIHHPLRTRVEYLLSAHSLSSRGLFDPESVHALIKQDSMGRVDAAYVIFALMCIELWCRIFLDQP